MKRYILVVRDELYPLRRKTDEGLKMLDCYYQSPIFESDGSLTDLDKKIDYFQPDFSHFIHWTAEIIAV